MKFPFKKLFQLSVILSIILTIYIIIFNFNFPYIGAGVKITPENEMVVTAVEPKTWADKVGIERGDIILEINNTTPLTHQPALTYGLLEQVNTLEVMQDGIIKKLSVPATLFSYQTVFIIVIPLTVLLLCIFCMFYIYKSNKETNLKSAHLLNFFLLIISMAYISASASSRGDIISRFFNLALFTMVPVSYLHFIYQYFLELGKKLFNINYIKFGYILVLLNILTEISLYMNSVAIGFNRIMNLATFFIMLVLTFLLKFKGLKKIKYSEQAYIIKVLIVTNVLAFTPFLLFYVIPFIIFQEYIFSATFLASFLLLIPLSLVYQFVATKIYDIEFLLGRIRYYSLLAVIPTFIMLGIMFAIEEKNSSIYPIQLSVYIFLGMILVFYLKEIIDYRFRLKRFSEKYNYQDSIFKYTQSIRKAKNLDQVISELKQVIVDVLHVSRAYVIEVDKHKQIVSVDLAAKESDYSPYLSEIRDVSNEISKIIELDKGFVINIGETENKNFILLCLSALNTPILTRDENSWLKTLAFYTNVSLENFLKIDELMHHLQEVKMEGQSPEWLSKLLFSIEEKQRSNLAKDLHDSVLQDLVSLKRQCELAIADINQDDSQQLKEQLQQMNYNMTKIIKTTRETCQELRPQLLYDLGLVKALNKLVSQYQDMVDFEIRLNTGNFTSSLDIDTQLNLYRIVQELLTNAHKHSQATNVLIILVCIKEKIVLHYEDNGIGFDGHTIIDKTESMGLSGISERVKALKGTIEINTAKGQGVKVDIEL
ncbi:histidine kinase [Metabacillus malikii]|uniref:histidine kinase n=1 Tax=Metabacillus malikii TaxID=1504265 RepID=A0ABT9ZD56_9BACI|nr:histidine kinase [Metabacillus malikii]MDQ0229777.1 two-component system sensor histidine kinase ComP [Metabacillus malikii]